MLTRPNRPSTPSPLPSNPAAAHARTPAAPWRGAPNVRRTQRCAPALA